MADNPVGDEICLVCGKDAGGGRGFCHLFPNGRRVTLCSPLCVEMFQRQPAGFVSGRPRHLVLEEILEEIKWKNAGS